MKRQRVSGMLPMQVCNSFAKSASERKTTVTLSGPTCEQRNRDCKFLLGLGS